MARPGVGNPDRQVRGAGAPGSTPFRRRPAPMSAPVLTNAVHRRPEPTVPTALSARTGGLACPALGRRSEGGHDELERCSVAVAGGDPDPAAERPLDHQPAQI